MNTLPLRKHKISRPISTSHEHVALHDVDEREKNSEMWESDTNCTTKNPYSSCNKDMSSMYHGTWPLDRNIWDAESPAFLKMETSSVMSFASSSGGIPIDQLLRSPDESRRSSQQLEAKVDMVYSLLAMLGGQEHAEMGETLLALSISPESCLAMRQSGCLPLLVQLIQSDRDAEMRKKATKALHNLVKSQPDEKARKREMKILGLLETITDYTESLENGIEFICANLSPDGNKHPIQVISQIMKSSFDEGYRQAICQLGGIHSIAKLLEIEHCVHGSITEETNCNQLRKYACMILTNLTFGDSGNKALLCSYKDFIRFLLMQLQSPNDELRQVTAGVLRNLSWRADSTSKDILREVGSVKSLMKAAMLDNKENTLISILSALWNLSAHCTENKSEICSVDGALVFLIKTLSYKSPSESLAVVENCGGILRNISSQIAGRDDYRMILRKHNCFEILVNHLKSTSLTIVSNASGTLWNLSSQNAVDQEILWKLGAPSLLKNLNKSKHKIIAVGSSATLKNLLASRAVFPQIDFTQPSELRKQTDSTDADLPLDLSRKRPEMEFMKKSRNMKSSSSTSLNINETNSSLPNEKTSQIRASCSSSLPYVNSTRSGSSLNCLPVRSKYPDNYEDGLESSEEPFDFSRKYSETKSGENTQKEKCPESSYNYEKPKNENKNFSIYAETDLDQPTDYSLRYAENDTDSDSDECENAEKTRAEFVGDTVKTYCTEGTPYETPFNFSTSTSMSDLRMSDKNNSDNDKNAANACKTKEVLSGKVRFVPVQNTETENAQPGSSKMKSELSSGLMSPEKPMNYCEEGTPGYFSRVSSFGSLNSSPVCQSENKVPEEIHKENNEVIPPKINKIQPKVTHTEVKVVKFENNVNYCEETPLMFSRSSSLGSLDSIEQHSIQDDRSSVISDFSRLTSGIISPSELPDSPTQTIPPSPKPQKTPEFRALVESKSNILSIKMPLKSQVFEDDITKFKEESTPIHYSMATSLSSLTIDDQDDGQIQGLVDDNKKVDLNVEKDSNVSKEINVSQEQSNLPQLYSNVSRANIPRKPRRQIELISPSDQKQKSTFRNNLSSPLYETASGVSILTLSPEALPPPLPVENSVQTYCTEDTPAVLSHNGSISDLSLSTMSILDEEPVGNTVYLSENSSQSSAVQENMLRNRSTVEETKIKDGEQSKKQDQTGCSSKIRTDEFISPPYISAGDEVCLFAVENSPAQFSVRSSLSILTIGSSMMSDVNSFSLPKHNFQEAAQINCSAEVPDKESTVEQIMGTVENNEEIVREKSLENGCRQSNQECAKNENIFAGIKDTYSVDDTSRDQNRQHSTNVENSDILCESFPNYESKCVILEPKSGPFSSDSLKKKKRKWKWKWKFGSDANDEGYFKENLCPIENDLKEENSLNVLGSKSLDASYKKRKWWKWKFGTKENEPSATLVTDANTFAYLDVVPQDKQLSDKSPDIHSSKESENTLSRREDIFFKSDSYKDNRSKSKRWKWKWKFGSKDEENQKSEECMSLGLSKLKDSVSPLGKPEHCRIDDQLELPSLDNIRESRSMFVRSSSMFSRSMSEPPQANKSTGDFEVDGYQVKELEDEPTNSLIEECIQLDMTKKKELSKEVGENSNDPNTSVARLSEKVTVSLETEHCNTSFDHIAILEKCIRLFMPAKDEINSSAEHAVGCLNEEIYNAVDPIMTNKCVKESKIMQSSKENRINTISSAISFENPSEFSAIFGDYDTSTIVRTVSEMPLPMSTKYNQIRKNDLEFLRRQLCIADKHLLQEAVTRGISKEQEEFLIELLIMKRITTETRATENYNVDLKSVSHIIPYNEGCQVHENKIIPYSEEPLDPVTLSIVKSILQHKFQNCEYNDNPQKSTDLLGNNNSENCNFEIVLEERIKLTLAGNQGIKNISTVKADCDEQNFSLSRLCIQDNPSSRLEDITEKYQFSGASDDCKLSSSVKDHSQSVKLSKSINLDSCQKSDMPLFTNTNRNSNTMELSKSTSRLYDNLNADNLVKTFAKNEKAFNSQRDYAALVEECIQLGMPKKKEQSEDTLYANISELSGFSKCHSLTRHETVSKFRTEENEKSNTTTNKSNIVVTDAKALVEECMMMGMPKRNDTIVTKKSHNVKSSEETDKSLIVKTDQKPDYKSLLEECIQLGMPKNKEVFSETRSSSPKSLMFQVNSIRTQPVIPTSPLVRRIEQCVNDAHKSNPNEDPEEAIYANISTTVSYSRLMQAKSSESKSVKNGLCGKQDYSALVDECIKLGMPSRKRSQANIIQENRHPNEISSNKNTNYEALIEECIQLGMPKRKDTSEDAIYANTLERYSSYNISPTSEFGCTSLPSRRMLRSDSEPGFNKIPFVNIEDNRSASALAPHRISMDRALEECTQLGWPKNKDLLSRRTMETAAINNPSRTVTVEKIKGSESKNVNVASVARNMPEYRHTCFKTLAMATGAEEDSKLPGAIRQIKVPEIKEVQQVEQEKNGYKYIELEYPLEWMDESVHTHKESEEGSEMSFAELADVDAKLLDPAAMLTALDKYTAELISQAELRLKFQNIKS